MEISIPASWPLPHSTSTSCYVLIFMGYNYIHMPLPFPISPSRLQHRIRPCDSARSDSGTKPYQPNRNPVLRAAAVHDMIISPGLTPPTPGPPLPRPGSGEGVCLGGGHSDGLARASPSRKIGDEKQTCLFGFGVGCWVGKRRMMSRPTGQICREVPVCGERSQPSPERKNLDLTCLFPFSFPPARRRFAFAPSGPRKHGLCMGGWLGTGVWGGGKWCVYHGI